MTINPITPNDLVEKVQTVETEVNTALVNKQETLIASTGISIVENAELNNFIKVGNPTITNKVASGFSASNYIKLPETFDPSQNFELMLKFNTGAAGQISRGLFSVDTAYSLTIGFLQKLCIWTSSTGSSWYASNMDNNGTTTLSANTNYYLKAVYNSGVLTVYLSTDKETWTTEYTQTISLAPVTNNFSKLGLYRASGSPLASGNIDLSETYLKVNDVMWWEPYVISDHPVISTDALRNTATGTSSLTIGGTATTGAFSVNVGGSSSVAGYAASFGYNAQATGSGATALGYYSSATGRKGISLGNKAITTAIGAIQLGQGTNSTAGTMSVGLSTTGNDTDYTNYQLLDSSGNIPAARLGALPVNDGEYTLKLTIADGVPTLTWVSTT